ncbi:MAG: cold-shock protein [Oxalobacteraceae bacterium]|nr:MAG: cold-shock protein [Oxalobacteraceae bacterium]
MPTGTVKWFSVAKGFGFITPDDGTADVFLHISKVEEANLPTLENGIALRYSIGSRNGKVFAEGLSVISKPSNNHLRDWYVQFSSKCEYGI